MAAPPATPMLTPRVVATAHIAATDAGSFVPRVRSANHCADPIIAPAIAPASNPDKRSNTGPATPQATAPPIMKLTKVAVQAPHQRALFSFFCVADTFM